MPIGSFLVAKQTKCIVFKREHKGNGDLAALFFISNVFSELL